MYKYIALTALVLGSAALGFNMNRGGEDPFTLALVEINYPTPQFNQLCSIDLDSNGLDDLLSIRTRSNPTRIEINARMNLGDLPLSPWETLGTYEVDPLPDDDSGCLILTHMDLVDLNGDGYTDLVLRMYEQGDGCIGGYGWAWVYLINNGSGGFTCAGDVTDDGRTNVDDLLGVIADWGCIEEGQPD